jgi:hypothetical protein
VDVRKKNNKEIGEEEKKNFFGVLCKFLLLSSVKFIFYMKRDLPRVKCLYDHCSQHERVST